MGRKPKLGRFSTLEARDKHIRFLYFKTSCSMAQVARNVGVCERSVARVVNEAKEDAKKSE